MSTLLIILTVLTIMFLIILIWGIFDIMKDDLIAIGVVGLLIIGILGWGLWGCLGVLYTKTQSIKCEVEKTSREVIVYPREYKKEIFESKYDYDNINDSTQFYYQVNYNHYGFEISRTLKYK